MKQIMHVTNLQTQHKFKAPRPTYGYGGGGGGVRLRSPRGGLLAGIQERLRLHCVFLCDFRHRGPVRAAAGKKK